jgi:hypothetical protein
MSDVLRRLIVDLDHVTGPAVLMVESCNGAESIERGKGRYIAFEDVPKGLIFGPHTIDNPIKT